MSLRIKPAALFFFGLCCISLSTTTAASIKIISANEKISDKKTLAEELGWVKSDANNCGGYYLEQPFHYPKNADKKSSVEVTGSQALYSQRGTTILEGKVSLMRFGQQVTANKAYLYRDQSSGKLSSMDLLGNVHLREPNTLVVAKSGHYEFDTRHKSLRDILYRTVLLNGKEVAGPNVSNQEIKTERKVDGMTAWGQAAEFKQTKPRVYHLNQSSFSTCPPVNPAWRVKASHIELNKNTGRGYATNACVLVKGVPVFYWPYLNFSIDHRRKSGFLWPTVGVRNSSDDIYTSWGTYLQVPFYWNMAPNYDMTITPGILTRRGLLILDRFRYMSAKGYGDVKISVLPEDSLYASFQNYARNEYSSSTNPVTESELNRLLNSSTTRKSLSWRDNTQFNPYWSGHVDFNYVGDDYYMRDFNSSVNEVTQNQLLQEGDLNFKSEHWDFVGRLQTYQTLHPINEPAVENQYRRFPQLILNTDYPDQKFGLDYFVGTEATHFDIRNTPGAAANKPIGNRFYAQPGINLPLYWPYFFINPRLQLSLTAYNLYQTADTDTPKSIRRAIPIFDMATGFAFNRETALFGSDFNQTLESQIYYTYIPYRNQSSIPIFDTTVNTLTYDQIFNYNRFSGLDRVGDANQVGIGFTTRFIDRQSGLEKIRAGIGDIIYFSNRRVTLCNNPQECTDNPFNPANHWSLSPISGILNYNVNPAWGFAGTMILNPINKQLSNSTVSLQYKPDEAHIINLGYGYVFNGDPMSGSPDGSSASNLKLTDFSFSWPITKDLSAVGDWAQNWNQHHLQNLVYGLQYDTCCWAMRFVGGRTFVSLDPTQNNAPKYNSEYYIQFALKGLGNIGSGNPNGLLKTITGYNTQFGQEF